MSQTEDFGGSGVGYVVVKREREGDDDPVLGAHVHADRIAPEHRHRHRVVDALCCPNDRIMMTMGGCEQGRGAGAGSTDGRQADPTHHLAASGRQRQAEGGRGDIILTPVAVGGHRLALDILIAAVVATSSARCSGARATGNRHHRRRGAQLCPTPGEKGGGGGGVRLGVWETACEVPISFSNPPSRIVLVSGIGGGLGFRSLLVLVLLGL